MSVTAYVPEKVFTGETFLVQHAVLVQDGKIVSVEPVAAMPDDVAAVHLPKALLAPAFIDLQIYGAGGLLLSAYPTAQALRALEDYCLAGGATLFQPTVATNTTEVFHNAIDAVRQYRAEGGKAAIGLHVEGPWISMEKRGAHLPQCIHAPTPEEAEALMERGKGIISMVTLAPEVVSEEVIRLIQSYGVVVSAGHSNASFAQATKAFGDGIGAATHLYNAMSGLQHRAPGMVGAVLLHHKIKASIIPDGHHVDYAAVSIAKAVMKERLFAITDAVTETNEGPYPHQLFGDKFESNTVLSGSALTMHKAFTNLVQHAGISVDEALRMCSLYPAQVMHLDKEHGRLAPGCAAQMLVLNEHLALQEVING